MHEKDNRRAVRGSLLLLITSVIWGAAFAAQRAGMDHMGPFFFSGIRMLLGGLVMIPVARIVEKKMASESKSESDFGTAQKVDSLSGRISGRKKQQRLSGLLCGLFLFAATSLQQVGLVSTSAGKAGFLTALYVVLVPVAGLLLFRRHAGHLIWAGVALAVVALYLLCIPAGGFQLEQGDLLLIGCAVCFTGQILCIDQYASSVNGAALARDEFLITGILSLLIAFFTETISWSGIRDAILPILYTGLLSSAVGYTLQIFAQRDVDPTVASLLMCLEAVFAVLTGALLLGERMTFREILGSIFMFSAVVLAQLSPVLEDRRNINGF